MYANYEMYRAPIKDNIVQEHMKTMDKISYNMKSSMQRDMEKVRLLKGRTYKDIY